jgi:hypothetical protein
MHYLGQWGGGGPGHSWALKWHRANAFAPMKSIMHRAIRIIGQWVIYVRVNEVNPGPILLCGAHTVVL